MVSALSGCLLLLLLPLLHCAAVDSAEGTTPTATPHKIVTHSHSSSAPTAHHHSPVTSSLLLAKQLLQQQQQHRRQKQHQFPSGAYQPSPFPSGFYPQYPGPSPFPGGVSALAPAPVPAPPAPSSSPNSNALFGQRDEDGGIDINLFLSRLPTEGCAAGAVQNAIQGALGNLGASNPASYSSSSVASRAVPNAAYSGQPAGVDPSSYSSVNRTPKGLNVDNDNRLRTKICSTVVNINPASL